MARESRYTRPSFNPVAENNLNTRLYALILMTSVAAMPAWGQTQGTPGPVGSYSFFWTTGSGNSPISSLDALPGSTLTVRLWMRETSGNLTANNIFGIASYDTRITWSGGTSTLRIPTGAGAATAENTNVRTNPYASGGFNGPGVFRNNQTDAANAAQALNLSRAVLSINDTSTWVNNAIAPNNSVTGALLINQLTFQVDAAALTSSTLTAGQRPDLLNWQYGFDANGSTALYFDDRIGAGTSSLVITPVPEPATVGLIAIAALGVASARWRRARVTV